MSNLVRRKIKVVGYDRLWPKVFYAIAKDLKTLLKEAIYDAHHVGSTAVPNMYARPVIDVVLAPRDFDVFELYKKKMLQAGYRFDNAGDQHTKKVFIKKGPGGVVRQHVTVYRDDGEICRHIKLRDYLINEPDQVRHFSRLKQVLIAEDPYSIKKYTEKKSLFIDMLEKKMEAERIL
ncbi:MAG: GrpB family protein [Epsilonproteobacteria bacterium]|nr:GrpB family protein [Campylobacterota bacterium]